MRSREYWDIIREMENCVKAKIPAEFIREGFKTKLSEDFMDKVLETIFAWELQIIRNCLLAFETKIAKETLTEEQLKEYNKAKTQSRSLKIYTTAQRREMIKRREWRKTQLQASRDRHKLKRKVWVRQREFKSENPFYEGGWQNFSKQKNES